MKKRNRFNSRVILLVLAAVSTLAVSQAAAETARERQLAARVRKLEAELAKFKKAKAGERTVKTLAAKEGETPSATKSSSASTATAPDHPTQQSFFLRKDKFEASQNSVPGGSL